MFAEFRRSPSIALAGSLIVLLSCGGGTPAVPTQPTSPPAPQPTPVTVTSVVVGVAGLAPAVLAPGEKLQLFAQATSSDGTTADVTNTANWQSSNPVVAVVSSGGVLTAFAEGLLDVTATYQSRTGSLHAQVERPGCRATLSPQSLSFGALASSGVITVTMTRSDCRWTAKSNASWLPLSVDPGRSGNGQIAYSVPGNNNQNPRDADIVVSVVDGPAAIHKVHQERPVGCVYTVTPEKLTFGAAGGAGAFTVTTTPADCQWRITDTWSSLDIAGPTSGTGSATVRYTVAPNASVFDRTLRVQGLSGLNPPGIHTVSVVR